MAKKTTTTKRVRTQKVRARTTFGTLQIGGKLLAGKFAKATYLVIKTPDGSTSDYLEGARLYRLAKAIVRRFESAGA